VAGALAAVDRGLADPHERSGARRTVAADLFYQPGTATARAVHALYETIELESPVTEPVLREVRCPS
jgi:hypothetical protein